MNRFFLAASCLQFIFMFGCNTNLESKKTQDPIYRPLEKRTFYAESEVQAAAAALSADLGVLVTVSNPKDFSNEMNYKRTLNILSRSRSVILPKLATIDRIEVGPSSGITDNLGKFVLKISFTASEKEIVNFFTKQYQELQDMRDTLRDLNVLSGVNVQDAIGYPRENIPAIAIKLRIIAREVNLRQDPTFRNLILADYYGINTDGMTVNITDPEDKIISEMKSAIDARMRWVADLGPIATSIRLNVSYQPGVFTGAQLTDAIAMAKKNAVLIKSLTRNFNNFIIGKRWDIDRGTVSILVDYKATDEEIRQRLLEIEPPVTDVDFAAANKTILDQFTTRGYSLDKVVIDMDRSNENLELLRQFTTYVTSTLKMDLFKSLGVKSLYLMKQDATAFVAGSGVLFIKLPTTTAEIETLMTTWILNTEFDAMKMALGRHAISVELEWSVTLNASMTNNERLRNFNQWAFMNLNAKLKTDAKIRQLNVLLDTVTPTNLKDGVLTINLDNFAPDKMKDILFPPPPKPPTPPTNPPANPPTNPPTNPPRP